MILKNLNTIEYRELILRLAEVAYVYKNSDLDNLEEIFRAVLDKRLEPKHEYGKDYENLR